ncbi:hypothetical protein MBLNU230_g8550t1 [Neophaeotheca triangularis]
MAINIDPKDRRIIELETEIRLAQQQIQQGQSGAAWLINAMATNNESRIEARDHATVANASLDRRLGSIESKVITALGCNSSGSTGFPQLEVSDGPAQGPPTPPGEDTQFQQLMAQVKQLSDELEKSKWDGKRALKASQRTVIQSHRSLKRIQRENQRLRQGFSSSSRSVSQSTSFADVLMMRDSRLNHESPTPRPRDHQHQPAQGPSRSTTHTLSRSVEKKLAADDYNRYNVGMPTRSLSIKQEPSPGSGSYNTRQGHSFSDLVNSFENVKNIKSGSKLGQMALSKLSLSTIPRACESAPDLDKQSQVSEASTHFPELYDDPRLPPHCRRSYKDQVAAGLKPVGSGARGEWLSANPPLPVREPETLNTTPLPPAGTFELEGTQDQFDEEQPRYQPTTIACQHMEPALYNPDAARRLVRGPRYYGTSRDGPNSFSAGQYRSLMGYAGYLEDMNQDEYADEWLDYERHHFDHSAAEWQEYYESTVRPAYLAKQAERRVLTEADAEVPGTPATGEQNEGVQVGEGVVHGSGGDMSPETGEDDLLLAFEQTARVEETPETVAKSNEERIAVCTPVPDAEAAALIAGSSETDGKENLGHHEASLLDGEANQVKATSPEAEQADYKVVKNAGRHTRGDLQQSFDSNATVDRQTPRHVPAFRRHDRRRYFPEPNYKAASETDPSERLTIVISDVPTSTSLSEVLAKTESPDVFRAVYVDTSKIWTTPPLTPDTATILVVFTNASAAQTVVDKFAGGANLSFVSATDPTTCLCASISLLGTATHFSHSERNLLTELQNAQAPDQPLTRFVAITGYPTSRGHTTTGYNLRGAYGSLGRFFPQPLAGNSHQFEGEEVWVLDFAGVAEARRSLGGLKRATRVGGVFEGCGIGMWVTGVDGVGGVVFEGKKGEKKVGGFEGDGQGQGRDGGDGSVGGKAEVSAKFVNVEGFTFGDGMSLEEWLAQGA